jgi:phage N-6-adenine-methyltransferase
MKNRNLKHKDVWATPKEFYKKLDDEFNFDFDPCPLNFGEISPDKDGLIMEWGERNYINPPYSRKLKEAFVKRAIEESKNGKICVMLLPVSTSTVLFHDFILPNATEIRFVRGRIPFEGVNTFGVKVGKGSAPMHDSMIVVFDGTK